MLKHLGKLYEFLNEIVDEINLRFGFFTLWSISVYFVFVVFTAYSTFLIPCITDSNTIKIIIMNIIFSIIFTIVYLYVIITGSILTEEV